MNDLTKLLTAVGVLLAVHRIATSKRVCVSFGPLRACGTRR